ncbi:MAG: phosphate/phosphite/phosphonate ABC transporter substrate-binding protein [Pseudomonadota bacterium]
MKQGLIRRQFLGLLVAICILPTGAWGACLGDQNASKIFTVAVVPQLPPSVMYAKWAPVLELIGLKSRQCFDLEVPQTIPAFEKLLFSGKPDFAFVNPYHEVIAKKKKSYVPLLIDGRTQLTGIIVVRSNGPIQQVNDLQGKEVAFPAPNAFAASLLIRAELAKKGIQIYPKYLKTHASSYRAVAVGDVLASGGVNNTLMREEKSLREGLRILYETSGYAPHPFVANPRVPLSIRRAVTAAFISLGKDAVGQKFLEEVQIPSPIESDYQRDFAPLESLKLDKFMVLDAD